MRGARTQACGVAAGTPRRTGRPMLTAEERVPEPGPRLAAPYRGSLAWLTPG